MYKLFFSDQVYCYCIGYCVPLAITCLLSSDAEYTGIYTFTDFIFYLYFPFF